MRHVCGRRDYAREGGALHWQAARVPWMLSRGLSSAKTSCTEWKLWPGTTVNMAIVFQAGRCTAVGVLAGTPGFSGSTGYSSRPPPSCTCAYTPPQLGSRAGNTMNCFAPSSQITILSYSRGVGGDIRGPHIVSYFATGPTPICIAHTRSAW